MRAIRLGRIFGAEQGPSWMVSHTANPTPVLLARDHLRVFFNVRDAQSRGCLAWIDVDPVDPTRVLDIAAEPSLLPGLSGAYDDCGIANGVICRVGVEYWLYYMGWNLPANYPFRNSIGLAVSTDGMAFTRGFEGPLLDRSRHDPLSLSYPFITQGRAGRPWHMLYGTHRGSGLEPAAMLHTLTEAFSHDGIDWQPTGRDILALEPGEFGISRPWLVDAGAQEHLLYSVRKTGYKIGYATQETETGTWRRVSNDLLGPSTEDWDSEAACYAATIKVDETVFMFYCGNAYGHAGMGAAVIEV